MAEIKERVSAIIQLNTMICVLSTDSPSQSKRLKANMDLTFELLCDEKKDVLDRYGLLNPFEHGGVARPALFVIKPNGTICYRALEGVAQRVDLNHAQNFLSILHGDSGLILNESAPQKWIIPSFMAIVRTMMNMFAIGNSVDWKHFFTFPGNFVIIPVKKWLMKHNQK